MQYEVLIGKRAAKTMAKAPPDVQKLFVQLVTDLETKGPIRTEWRNFSSLSATTYHCHLNYSWVACWLWEEGTMLVEVYYAGSREDAPY
jgi:mRNA-degrading endonuclease RelE of RelBE toxin-antitoxin system